MKKLSGKKLILGAIAAAFVTTSAVGTMAFAGNDTPIAHAATVKKSTDGKTKKVVKSVKKAKKKKAKKNIKNATVNKATKSNVITVNKKNCPTPSSKQGTVTKVTSASDLNSILKQYGINQTTTKPSTTKPSTTTPSTSKPSTTKPSTSTPSTKPSTTVNGNYNENYANEVLTLVNKERSKAGLAPLKMNAAATNAAKVRAKEIVSKFDHTRPNGQSPFSTLDAAGAKYRTAGENIAWGQPNPSEVMSDWMNSPGHRANILKSNFKEIGIGAYYQNGKYYWVQLFIG